MVKLSGLGEGSYNLWYMLLSYHRQCFIPLPANIPVPFWVLGVENNNFVKAVT